MKGGEKDLSEKGAFLFIEIAEVELPSYLIYYAYLGS